MKTKGTLVVENLKKRQCKDCKAEDRTGPPLNAPYPGPRCFRHHKAHERVEADKRAERRHKNLYELKPGQYGAILELQGGGCAICGRKVSPRSKRRLAVDHDHSCCRGKNSCGECVRGLLCWSCNKFLEHIRDNPNVAVRMLNYLESPPARVLVLNQTRV